MMSSYAGLCDVSDRPQGGVPWPRRQQCDPGRGGALSCLLQVLLGEMSEPRLRGLLIGVPFVSYSVGILYVFLVGSLLWWRYVCVLSALPTIIGFIWLRFLPESPVWLVRRGQLKKAQDTLDWLRGGAGSVQVSLRGGEGRGGGQSVCQSPVIQMTPR